MSGHSKWANIKRKKEAQDKIRGNVFSKLSRIVTLAVIEGGGITDPQHNVKLRLAVEKAKQANMPKDNIQRAIERGAGPNKDQLKEMVYEAFAPGGVSLLILASTDNPNRTLAEIRTVLDKSGGKIGAQGSVSYLFEKCGLVVLDKNSIDEEKAFQLADQIGALDFHSDELDYSIYIPFEQIGRAKEIFKDYHLKELETLYRPRMTVNIEPDKVVLVENLIIALESLDDVHKVFSNL
jgi:YebC/PmpR family DNA-binding regulatory protein